MSSLFLDDDFLLGGKTARVLYHDWAAGVPIFDYHTHLNAQEIAEDRQFENIGQAWLAHDHYKWRAMRLNGVDESFCTGAAPAKEKFKQWAATLPMACGNPLHVWAHLELKRYFGIKDILNSDTADKIFEKASALLQTREFSARNLLKRMNVKAVCTTDDPADDLRFHKMIKDSGFEVTVLPTFRPDRARIITDPVTYNAYLERLGAVSGVEIKSFSLLIEALEKRHRYFAKQGCRSSDHSLQPPRFEQAGAAEIDAIFAKIRGGRELDSAEAARLETAILLELGRMDAAAGWVMQLHIGASRNLSSRVFRSFGPDAGCDAIGDYQVGEPLRRFLDALDVKDSLPKVIAYNLNPRDTEMILSILGSFARGPVPGKMQYGPAWWFMDQRDGMERHLEALSALGLIGRFVGMTTDSRSLLSYPRHEYFRRILCDFIGQGVERGEWPYDEKALGQLVQNICYKNAETLFKQEK